MDKNIQLKRLIIMLIVALLFGAIAYFSYGTGRYLPGQQVELSDIADVAIDDRDNTYALNSGGYEVVRFNEENDADLVIKGLGNKDNSFERALRVAVDADGNIYVHNRIASEDAVSWIGQENIKVYDKYGRYLYTSCDIDYDVPVLKASIIALQTIKGEVFAFSTDNQALLLENVKNGDISMYKFEGAAKYINSACYDVKRDCVYATTRDGRILMIQSDGYRVIYKTPLGDTTSGLFKDICIDDRGQVYVCDAKLGQVLTLKKGKLAPFFWPNYIVNSMDFAKEFVFNETYSVVSTYYDRFYSLNATRVVGLEKFRGNLFVISLLIVVLALLYPLYFVAKRIINSNSDKVKLISALTIIIAVLTASFCMLVGKEYTNILSEEVIKRAEEKAKLINHIMSSQDFENLQSVTDFNGVSYRRIKKVVDNVILEDGRIPEDMYLIMYTLEGEDTVIERYTLEEMEGCNYPYVWSDGVDERTVYETGTTFQLEDATDAEGSFLCIYSPITNEKEEVIGVIEVGTDITIFKKAVQKKIVYFAISVVALAAVFILLILELLEFVESKKGFSYKLARIDGTMPPLKLYRIAVFMVFFVTNITTPFLSIYAVSLSDKYNVLTGVPAEILAAVPISAEVLFGAIFSLLGGNIIKKMGSRKAGLFGAIMFTVGLAIRFFYPDLLVLTLGNAIQGAGWGVVLLIINARIASEEDEVEQEKGFTDYNVALQNGINSGIVLGGFLLTFANYKAMLIFATLLSVTILIFAYMFINDDSKDKENESEEIAQGNMSYVKFVFSPRVLVYFVCIVIPVIAASYYLNFLYPILGDRLGMSESIIGYSYLINGVVIICFGNLIVNFMSKYFDKKILLVIASILYLVTFAVVGMFNNILALLISLVLLGVSDSFGYVAQSTFYTELKETKQFGYEKAMGVYSLFENLSQSVGSFVFGYILTVGVKVGMTVYGVVIGASSVLFFGIVLICNKLDQNKERG